MFAEASRNAGEINQMGEEREDRAAVEITPPFDVDVESALHIARRTLGVVDQELVVAQYQSRIWVNLNEESLKHKGRWSMMFEVVDDVDDPEAWFSNRVLVCDDGTVTEGALRGTLRHPDENVVTPQPPVTEMFEILKREGFDTKEVRTIVFKWRSTEVHWYVQLGGKERSLELGGKERALDLTGVQSVKIFPEGRLER